MLLTGQIIQLSLVDLLLITAIVCTVAVTIASVRALRAAAAFFGKSEKLVDEAVLVVEDIQAKSKAADAAMEQIFIGGSKLLKPLLERKKSS